jgi:hypothetical protein
VILAKVFASAGHKIKVKTPFFAIKKEFLKVLSNFKENQMKRLTIMKKIVNIS